MTLSMRSARRATLVLVVLCSLVALVSASKQAGNSRPLELKVRCLPRPEASCHHVGYTEDYPLQSVDALERVAKRRGIHIDAGACLGCVALFWFASIDPIRRNDQAIQCSRSTFAAAFVDGCCLIAHDASFCPLAQDASYASYAVFCWLTLVLDDLI